MSTDMRCSFCGKSANAVAKLIAGPAAFICNECVMLSVEILEEDPTRLPSTEGQLLVRFPDATMHTCDREGPWHPFAYPGGQLEWCRASGFVRSAAPVAVIAVRKRGTQGPILGATFAGGASSTEADAAGVVEAFGGASRFEVWPTRRAGAHSASGTTRSDVAFPMGFQSDQLSTDFGLARRELLDRRDG